MMTLQINDTSSVPKYRQIVAAVLRGIETGALQRDDQLPSINELSEEYYLARDTVEKAYNVLKQEGIIEAVRGKGFYVRQDAPGQLRVLLLINKLSAYKKQVYYALLHELGPQATVELRLHHHDADRFARLVAETAGQYHYYVVMPHFYDRNISTAKLLAPIPPEKLVLLDKDVPELPQVHGAVFQQFERDIYDALVSGLDLLAKYDRIVLVFPRDVRYPPEIVQGVRAFCAHHGKPYAQLDTLMGRTLDTCTAYLVLEDTDLAELVRQARSRALVLGQDVGVVSFNETPLKEVLADGITVVSTDHEQMGRQAARLMLTNVSGKRLRNTFMLIRRASL